MFGSLFQSMISLAWFIIVGIGLIFSISQIFLGTRLGGYTIALAYITHVAINPVVWFRSLKKTPIAQRNHDNPSVRIANGSKIIGSSNA